MSDTPAAREAERAAAWATTTRRRSRSPAGSSFVAVAVVAVAMAWSVGFGDAGGVLLVSAYGVLGLVLALKRPGQPLAWLLVLIAVGLALGTTRPTAPLDALLAGSADPLGRFTAWANGIG